MTFLKKRGRCLELLLWNQEGKYLKRINVFLKIWRYYFCSALSAKDLNRARR